MEKLLHDSWKSIQGYYDGLVTFLPKLAIAIVIFLLFLMVAAWLRRFSRRSLNRHMEDPLLADFLSRTIKVATIAIGFIAVLKIIGLGGAATSLVAGAGISAFIIGFAFKDIGENFLAGILMAFKRPFRIGDIVETSDIAGTVVGLTLRDTQIKTFDGKDVFIPNGMIMKNPIVNRTIDGYLRFEFDIGLDYDDDIQEGIRIIQESVQGVAGVLDEPGKKVGIMITNLGTSTVNIKTMFWLDMDDPAISGITVMTNAMQQSMKALTDAGFYLPADILEIKNYHDNSIATEARTTKDSAA